MTARLLGAAEKALDDFCGMREAEGEKLVADLSARADLIEDLKNHIEKRAPEIEREYAAKFKARVEDILGGVYEVPEDLQNDSPDTYDILQALQNNLRKALPLPVFF